MIKVNRFNIYCKVITIECDDGSAVSYNDYEKLAREFVDLANVLKSIRGDHLTEEQQKILEALK